MSVKPELTIPLKEVTKSAYKWDTSITEVNQYTTKQRGYKLKKMNV